MLYVLMIQNNYFKLNLEKEIEGRKKDFEDVWSKPQDKATP